MPKSTPSPTNSTKKATEITLKAPTTARPAAGELAHRAGEDDAERAQREPQDDQHGEQRERRVELGVVFDGAELVVLHGNAPGQPYLRLIVAVELEVGDDRL